MNHIPNHIANKVKDRDWNDTFAFEEMPCNHAPEAKDHIKVNCEKCNYDKREAWLEATLTEQDPNETILEKGKQLKLSKIIIVRGKYDDCIATEKVFG